MLLERILVLLAGLIVAACLGFGLLWMAVGPEKKPAATQPALADGRAPTQGETPGVSPQDRARARAKIEALVAAAPEYARFFDRLREAFPADHEAALDEFANRLVATKQEDSAEYYVSEAARRLQQARGILASKADAAPLGRVFDMQLAVLKAVSKQDARLCVGFLYGATSPDFQRFAATQRSLVANMALAGLEAIMSGQTKKNERGAPTEGDFRMLEKALVARGLSKAEIDALLDGKMPDPPLEDARMCAAGQTYFDVLHGLPEPVRLRIYGLAVELMARS